MSVKTRNWKTRIYLPLSIGALAFAAFGIVSAIQAAGDENSRTSVPDSYGIEQNRQPDGGSCSPEQCAACGLCSSGQFNRQIESDATESSGSAHSEAIE